MGNLSEQISEERKKLELEIEDWRSTIRSCNESIREAESRLSKLNQLKALHDQLFEAAPAPSTGDLIVSMGPIRIGVDMGPEGQSKKDRILGSVEKILMDGRRRTTRELLDELTKQGIEVGGRDEMNNLAAYLSPQKERFNSDRKAGGWGLNNLPKKGSPDERSRPSGLAGNGVSSSHSAN